MALVNVAVDLARSGRKVLAVDFDLEAPGLDTFDLTQHCGTCPGIIDFVSTYIETGSAPRARDFVFESTDIGSDHGSLWIMPSGAQSDSYAKTFAEIDWATLYERHDGYLLFEDLKAQWKELLDPDYVLIDSRTGHTDIGGICTRQLPDAVVILFFPNAQTLRGLTKVVRDIRTDSTESDSNVIDLHFVMSNVPDLDDEDKILEHNIASFQSNLGFRGDPLIIHRYDSLSLLNQVIFSKDRRRSRLAREYGALATAIMRLNPRDRDGALMYIDSISQNSGISRRFDGARIGNIDDHLSEIEANFQNDGEVLFRSGSLRAEDGRFDDAVTLFDSAIDAGYHATDVFLRRADLRRLENDHNGASSDAKQALDARDATAVQVRRALAMILPEQLDGIADSPAVMSLSPDDRIRVASDFNRSRRAAKITRMILLSVVGQSDLATNTRTRVRNELILASIAIGMYSDALNIALEEQPEVHHMDIQFAFNYGMALWGDTGQIVRDPFERVVALEREAPRKDPDANFLQCMSIAYWAMDLLDEARQSLEDARRKITRRPRAFSCWRYSHVLRHQFVEDLGEFLKLIDGDNMIRPRYFQ